LLHHGFESTHGVGTITTGLSSPDRAGHEYLVALELGAHAFQPAAAAEIGTIGP
jgi:hypothetical protein